ncbi:woronin body major protein [Didymosphaeria variabile]|uniref:Woronin body major protein n=1 Tax=Didymosphaeria variabile TaxID=1932322 RepID=A0A9W8XQ78_9PLEO|nr:woronin body major protein [Didymosphaeria variabile]KAJ4355551.1 woronin body major protein [Didymosphaeria variabile]
MGYYDDDGHYHSFRHGIKEAAHKVADHIAHPIHGSRHHHSHDHSSKASQHKDIREDIVVKEKYTTTSAPAPTYRPSAGPSTVSSHKTVTTRKMAPPNTITIPCHHIRIGDLLILQGRPCQVIRITTSSQTGQHRYLGVDLFTKQLHEESSFISNPAPSVVVQNMLGPVFKQYRVLDIREDGRVVAMTETGDVKQGLPILDQSNLLQRLTESFDNGRGSVRILVINDDGMEMAVDYKVVHGSRL